MIRIHLPIQPPSVTAQQKRVTYRHGKPAFFHDTRMTAEANTWAALLMPYRPDVPLDGPLVFQLSVTYPHTKVTAKHGDIRVPKATRPDVDNLGKHLIDTMVRLRFLVDDARIHTATITKWHGPAKWVGLDIALGPVG